MTRRDGASPFRTRRMAGDTCGSHGSGTSSRCPRTGSHGRSPRVPRPASGSRRTRRAGRDSGR
ncbi:hypothetical protein CIK81_08260 [Brachybacterium sp. JB7]|nr:hypothetical protein CIK81_08260 [Brachybacterium sp. JB7]RCS71006.1 hypothetical protein CIK73_04450 [Brachybacterium alimentarium]RCS74776.1 hypothetical protein CIK68_05795 [Brachybacterium alimentarium]RCS76423.1 hypothetical protein CIK72_15850 [Brachybacterium alimentarium]RCS79095.1 hypothetical protein CIK70_08310 [Brachybacterium alimentarium]